MPEQTKSPEKPSSQSKALGSGDESGADFVRELLNADPTFAINFDRLQFDPVEGRYIIFEFLLCEEKQACQRHHAVYQSPAALLEPKQAEVYFVVEGSPKTGSTTLPCQLRQERHPYSDQILVIEILDMDNNGISRGKVGKTGREEFAQWFREMNNRCAG